VALGRLPHPLGEVPPGRHHKLVSVHTLPRTARHKRLCGAFGGRVGLSLGLLLCAALSARVGGLSCRLWTLNDGRYSPRAAPSAPGSCDRPLANATEHEQIACITRLMWRAT
jgi:hypothetical protein